MEKFAECSVCKKEILSDRGMQTAGCRTTSNFNCGHRLRCRLCGMITGNETEVFCCTDCSEKFRKMAEYPEH